MDNKETELRKRAIARYLSGEQPVKIYKELNKSKQWFFKWLNRYDSAKRDKIENWYDDKPSIPLNQPFKTRPETENLIVNIRQKLAKHDTPETKYAHIGAESILWELEKLGIPEKDIPSIATIKRIVKRNNLVIPRKSWKKGSNKYYPSPIISTFNDVHQFDIVGRRYIRGTNGVEGFYSYHLKELYSHYLKLRQYLYKDALSVIDFFVNVVWKTIGFPKILQLDNILASKGSNRYPRSFSNLIKLCLMFGIEVLFIPESEPWRSGVIESFNDIFDKKFFRAQRFDNLAHLMKESEIFENFYNTKRPNSALSVKEHGSKLPAEVAQRFSPRLLDKEISLDTFKTNGKLKLPISDGKISFIRWIKEDLVLRIFTERFILTKPLANEYVKATIYTKEQVLRVFYQDELISEYKYKINK